MLFSAKKMIFAAALLSGVPIHATTITDLTLPAIQAPQLTDPQLANVVGDRFGFRAASLLSAQELGPRLLSVQAEVGREIMDVWWAEQATDMIAANLLR